MADEPYVPTTAEIWDFLVGLKETTEAGFLRMEARFDNLESRFTSVESRLTAVESAILRIERRLARQDDRISGFEDVNAGPRLDDLELRITRLEERFA